MLSIMAAMVVASTAQWSCGDEDLRVTRHLEDALSQLRSVTPVGLSADQAGKRAHLLGDLRRYIDAQQFPRNAGEVTPVFVDADDRHCAMGALIEWNGGAEIVEHIRSTRNLATVPTLVDEPGLAQWLRDNGMTVEEAALVQPSYYVCTPALDVCFRRPSSPAVWYSNGEFLPDRRGEFSRPATEDGQCASQPVPGYIRPLPKGVLVEEPSGLIPTGTGYVHASWAYCRNPLRIGADALNAGSVEACMRSMVAADPRSVLPSCGDDFGRLQNRRCADDGRFFGSALPRAGSAWALSTYFASRGLDAGLPAIDFDALDRAAWGNSDDGGTVPAGDLAQLRTWNGVNASTCVLYADGGVQNVIDGGMGSVVDAGVTPVDEPQGCSTGIGFAVALTSLLLGSRSRRSNR